jgi:predicted nucleic acid-binding protein
MLVDSGLFRTNVSVPLVAEYEAVAKRMLDEIPMTEQEVDGLLDYVCAMSNRQPIFYLWRPFLPDAGDDMVLELAVASQCQYIITFNRRHFRGVDKFGIEVLTPREFLGELGILS